MTQSWICANRSAQGARAGNSQNRSRARSQRSTESEAPAGAIDEVAVAGDFGQELDALTDQRRDTGDEIVADWTGDARGQVALEHLCTRLGIEEGGTTADGLFTVQKAECLGACADAPVMLVNDRQMCSFMTPERLDELVAMLASHAVIERAA